MPAEAITPAMQASERLAVVDSADRVIGTAPRTVVHRRGWRHRAVHIIVTRDDGALYVQRRAEHKDMAPGLWDTSAAGHVDAGEAYDAAARRELDEELGLHCAAMRALWCMPANALTGQEFVRVYVVCATTEPRPDPYEIAAARWFSRAELRASIDAEPARYTGVFRAIFAAYCTRLDALAASTPPTLVAGVA